MPDRRVRRGNFSDCSIDEFLADFASIFGSKDSKRTRLDIWMHAVEHASRLAEELRRERYDKVQVELAGVAAWAMSFVSRCQADDVGQDGLIRVTNKLSDILWNKYPNICPVCERPECGCLAQLARVEERNRQDSPEMKKARKERVRHRAETARAEKIHSMGDLEAMFRRIFAAPLFVFSIESIGFHLLEEIGEVCNSIIRLYTFHKEGATRARWLEKVADLEEELADVFSWLFGLGYKLRLTFEMFDRHLEGKASEGIEVRAAQSIGLGRSIVNAYTDKDSQAILRCKYCRNSICDCDIHFVTNIGELH